MLKNRFRVRDVDLSLKGTSRSKMRWHTFPNVDGDSSECASGQSKCDTAANVVRYR